jgi:iron-sulfur cluster assembly accessory protein
MSSQEEQVTTEGIRITPEAAEQIRLIRKENNVSEAHGLRIGIQEGGCCGFSYYLGFDEKAGESDSVFQSEGTNILVDAQSLPYLAGATLHFVDGPEGKGFKFDNPNISRSCNCENDCSGH